ncbi:MAG: hypothetical protein DI560_04570 [Pseudomonas putida]|nr:MAG: hypothetical protein DI560_04570 [Pseudomonas putida]
MVTRHCGWRISRAAFACLTSNRHPLARFGHCWFGQHAPGWTLGGYSQQSVVHERYVLCVRHPQVRPLRGCLTFRAPVRQGLGGRPGDGQGASGICAALG